MELRDRDLFSIQETRDLIEKAKLAQKTYRTFAQKTIDVIVAAVAKAALDRSVELAKLAHEETGFGKWEDKVIKNTFAAVKLHDAIKDMKTTGIISEDPVNKIFNVAVPVGIVAALIPSTNPTSTVIYKALISLKSGNAVIFSPHPKAIKCILETVRIVNDAAVRAGAPDGLVSCIKTPTKEATDELMSHKDTGLILATGGTAMVKAAYSSGTPALGVGPGNTPAFIERSADIKMAVKRIMDSKTFDNSTICASEQSVVTEGIIKNKVIEEFQNQGGYFLSPEESNKVGRILMSPFGGMNPKIVGKPAEFVAKMAGISIPEGTKVLLSEQTQVGKDYPFSREKLTTVLGFYVEENWETACDRCIELLENEGAGHTLSIHCTDESIIREFGLKKPVSRVLVNTSSSLGGVGGTTGLFPSMTLGCGAVGGSATSDNVSPLNLINIRRVAYGLCEVSDLKGKQKLSEVSNNNNNNINNKQSLSAVANEKKVTEDLAIDKLVEEVIKRLGEKLA